MAATRPITKLEPLDCWITPANVVVSTPSSLAMCSAWATSWMFAANNALFTSFTASAVPSPAIVKIGSAYAATVVARALDVVRRAADHHRERAREHVVGAAAERRVDDVPVARGGDPLDGRRAPGRVRDEERVVGEVRRRGRRRPSATSSNCSSEYTPTCTTSAPRAASARESVTVAPAWAKCSRTSARRAYTVTS